MSWADDTPRNAPDISERAADVPTAEHLHRIFVELLGSNEIPFEVDTALISDHARLALGKLAEDDQGKASIRDALQSKNRFDALMEALTSRRGKSSEVIVEGEEVEAAAVGSSSTIDATFAETPLLDEAGEDADGSQPRSDAREPQTAAASSSSGDGSVEGTMGGKKVEAGEANDDHHHGRIMGRVMSLAHHLPEYLPHGHHGGESMPHHPHDHEHGHQNHPRLHKIMSKAQQAMHKAQVWQRQSKHAEIGGVITNEKFEDNAKHIFRERTKELRNRVVKSVEDEFRKVALDVNEVMKEDHGPAGGDDDVNTVMAAMIAPTRLRMLTWYNAFMWGHAFLFFVANLICSISDWDRPCDNLAGVNLNSYFLVSLMIEFTELVIRSVMFLKLRHFWDHHDIHNIIKRGGGGASASADGRKGKKVIEALAEKGIQAAVDFSKMTVKKQSQHVMAEMMADAAEVGDEAVCLKRDMDKQWYAKLLVLVHPFYTVWRLIGTRMWFALRCLYCEKNKLDWLLTIVSGEFMIMGTYHLVRLLALMLFVKLKYFEVDGLRRWATHWDARTTGLPLMLTLVESYFVEDGSHIRKIVIRRNKYEIKQLARERKELCEQANFLQNHIVKLEAELAILGGVKSPTVSRDLSARKDGKDSDKKKLSRRQTSLESLEEGIQQAKKTIIGITYVIVKRILTLCSKIVRKIVRILLG